MLCKSKWMNSDQKKREEKFQSSFSAAAESFKLFSSPSLETPIYNQVVSIELWSYFLYLSTVVSLLVCLCLERITHRKNRAINASYHNFIMVCSVVLFLIYLKVSQNEEALLGEL